MLTTTRAEYGLLREVIRRLAADPRAHLQLSATGTQLSPELGSTVGLIEADGIAIDERVEMLLSSDSAIGATKSLGVATLGP